MAETKDKQKNMYVNVKIINLPEIESKMEQLNSLVKEANSLLKELASTEIEIKVKNEY